MRRYIVYKVTNRFDGKIYIGCHSTLNTSDRYMGSGTEIREAIKKFGRSSFIKETLFDFDTKEEMLSKEKELVTKEFCHRIDTYNRVVGGGSYSTIGMVTVKNKNGNTSKVYCDDPRYISGELIHVSKGIPNYSWLGRNHSEDSKNKMRGKKSKLTKDKISKSLSLISSGENNTQFGTIWIKKENESKKIKKEELIFWTEKGWTKGRIYNKKI